jgi:hypothetical protein
MRIKNFIWAFLAIIILGSFIYKMLHRALTDLLLRNNPQIIRAVIIDEKNYLPNHDVVGTFSYSYSFKINSTTYTNNSHDQTLKIGDSTDVEYVKNWPGFNRPVHPNE